MALGKKLQLQRTRRARVGVPSWGGAGRSRSCEGTSFDVRPALAMLTGPAVFHVTTHGGWRADFAGAATSGPVTSSPWPDPLRGHRDVGALPPPTQDRSDALDQARLRRSLVLAGAASQVVSLWSVADASTPALRRDYYAALQQGTERAEALRQAKRRLLQQPGTAHPFYWAAFIPAGDWRPLDATAFRPQRSTP